MHQKWNWSKINDNTSILFHSYRKYDKISNISAPNPKTWMHHASPCNCLCSIHWRQALSREWRGGWSSAHGQCSNYIWVISKFIVHWVAPHIRYLTAYWLREKLCISRQLWVMAYLRSGAKPSSKPTILCTDSALSTLPTIGGQFQKFITTPTY